MAAEVGIGLLLLVALLVGLVAAKSIHLLARIGLYLLLGLLILFILWGTIQL